MSWKEEIKKNTKWDSSKEWRKQNDRHIELFEKIKGIWRTEVDSLDFDDIGMLSRHLVEYANLPVGDDDNQQLLKYSEELKDLYNKMEYLLKVQLGELFDDMGM